MSTPSLSDLRRKVAHRLGPFWLFLFLSVALNAYPIAAAIRAATEYNGDVGECRRAVAWLYANMGLSVVHVIFAIYIAAVGRTLVKRWADNNEGAAAATAAATKAAAAPSKSADGGKTAAETDAVVAASPDSQYVAVEGSSGSATEEDLADVAHSAASAPTAVDVLGDLSSRWTLRMYFLVLVCYLCWTAVGLERHMMNAGYCGGDIRGHVADSVLCAVLFLVLGQGALCFGAWRAARVMAQGRVSGLSLPAYGVEA